MSNEWINDTFACKILHARSYMQNSLLLYWILISFGEPVRNFSERFSSDRFYVGF